MADFAKVLHDELEIIEHRRIGLLRASGSEEKAPGDSSTSPEERRPRTRRVATTVVPEQPGAGESDQPESAEMAARLKALDLHIAGLAISGGGIRSATFALGVIQALAHLKLLR
jgi:hypothetical protein